MYDIIIVGAGPAGLTAAIYGRRANKSVLLIEKETFGGQITFSPKVENIPGFVSATGNEFSEKLVDQAIYQGADTEMCTVTGIDCGKYFTVKTDEGDFEAKAVIIATGAKHRLLGLEREEDFIGNGISFCAVCDGAFYENKEVAVIGGGNSALQEAILLADIAKKVYVVQNLDFLTGEKSLCDSLYSKDNVEVILGSVVTQYLGGDELSGIKIKSEKDNSATEISLDGVFLAVGLVPQNENFSNVISLNDRGYAASDENCLGSVKGIFVAGDCRDKKIRQVTTAVSDGAVAALAACDYIDSLQDYK